MALTQVTGPYPIFTDLDGSPLDDGYLYIGAVNQDPETNPIQAYWDSNLTIPATQPIRTNNGYAWRNGTPGLIYTAGQFSITIRNKKNEFVLYSPVGYGFDPGAVSASVVKNDFVGDGVETDFALSAAPSTKLATNVFINGVYQEKDSYNILGNVLTFSIAPPLSSSIEVMTNETGVINSGNASVITYTLPAPGAVQQTVQTRLEQYVSAKDFGAAGDGVTDDTAELKAAFDYAIPLGLAVKLEGTYLISGPIQPYASRASGSAHIICSGNVIINVSGGASAFRDLFYLETAATNNCSITGGSLTIDCNNKAASGITFRHTAANQSGVVNISCPVEVLNCYNNDAGATYENHGIAVIGDYETVVIERPRVVGVSRASVNGACKGISVSGFSGVVTINQPYAANILTGAGTVDADGIAVFGKVLGGTYAARGGIANVNEPVFVDCQGRSLKSQCSDTTVFRPRVFRKDVVTITNGHDFDFQTGGQSLLIEPYYEYRLNGATSPLGPSFICASFQQLLDNKQNVGKSIGGVLRTEVLVPNYAFAFHQATALASYTQVDGLVVEPIGALTTKAIDRAILEFEADDVGAKSTKTALSVRNCRGLIGTYAIGYTSYNGSALTSKLSFEVTDNYNTSSGILYSGFGNLSGTIITAVEKFVLRSNYGFKALMPAGWTFDFNNLAPSNYFTVDIAAVSATNAPAWGASGYAFIESIDQWDTNNFQHIRVTVNNAAAPNTVFFTQGGATPTWGTIK